MANVKIMIITVQTEYSEEGPEKYCRFISPIDPKLKGMAAKPYLELEGSAELLQEAKEQLERIFQHPNDFNLN